jgi:signal transduction histidine kinase
MHSQRALAAELQRTTDQIQVETESRERLAVAEQRTRIARELQTLVADNVSSMIVQADAVQRLLQDELEPADEAMAVIEETGRAALNEMRLILGVLRRADQPADLAPQPGIGQIPALVDGTRTAQRHVTLRVEGEPGPLPASIDLGMYRILQDAVTITDTATLEVALRFGHDSVDLRVTSKGRRIDWPTVAIRERVALCEGELQVLTAGDDETLVCRLPRVLRGALV